MKSVLWGIYQFVTDSYPSRLTLKNVESGSCYKANRSPESQTEFEDLEFDNVCQADRPLPQGMRGRSPQVRKRYEKEYYYPMSTRPNRENQADMNNSAKQILKAHSSQDNLGATGGNASFHDISLSSSATDLNSSFQSNQSLGDLEQTSFFSSSSSSIGLLDGARPAATSSPTPFNTTRLERQPSPLLGHHKTSQEFLETFGPTKPSSLNILNQMAPANSQQHFTESDYFDSFFDNNSIQKAPNSSALFAPGQTQPQQTTSMSNSSILSVTQARPPSVPPARPPSVPPACPPSVPPACPPSVPPAHHPYVPPAHPLSVTPAPPVRDPSVPPAHPTSVPPVRDLSVPPARPPFVPPERDPSVPPAQHAARPPAQHAARPPSVHQTRPPFMHAARSPSVPPARHPFVHPSRSSSVPPKGRTSQLFGNMKHNDSFDNLSQVPSKSTTEQLKISAVFDMPVENHDPFSSNKTSGPSVNLWSAQQMENAPAIGPFSSKETSGPSVELRSAQQMENALNAPVTGPFSSKETSGPSVGLRSAQQMDTMNQQPATMPIPPMANAEASASSYPPGHDSMLNHSFESNQTFDPASKPVDTSSSIPPAQSTKTGYANVPFGHGGMTTNLFESGLSSNLHSQQVENTNISYTTHPVSGYGQPPNPHIGHEGVSHPVSGCGQPPNPRIGHEEVSHPVSGYGQPPNPHIGHEGVSHPVSRYGQPPNPHIGHEGVSHPVSGYGQPPNPHPVVTSSMSSPPIQNTQPSSTNPDFGSEVVSHSSVELPSAGTSTMSSPPMQNTETSSTNPCTEQSGVSHPSLEMDSYLQPNSPASQQVDSSTVSSPSTQKTAVSTANLFSGYGGTSSNPIPTALSFPPTQSSGERECMQNGFTSFGVDSRSFGVNPRRMTPRSLDPLVSSERGNHATVQNSMVTSTSHLPGHEGTSHLSFESHASQPINRKLECSNVPLTGKPMQNTSTSLFDPGGVPPLNAVSKVENIPPTAFQPAQHHQASYTSLPSGLGGTSHTDQGYVPPLNAVGKLEDTSPMVFPAKQHNQASYTSLPSGLGGTSHTDPGYVPPLNAVGKLEDTSPMVFPAKQYNQASYTSLSSGLGGTSHPEPGYVPPLNAVGKLADTSPMVFPAKQHNQASYTSLPSGLGGTSHPEPGYVPPLNAVGKLEDTSPMVFPAKQYNQASYTSLPSGHGGTSHPEPGYVPPLNAVGKLEYPAKQHHQASYTSLPSGRGGTSHPEPGYVPPLNAVGKLEDTPPMVFPAKQHNQPSYTSLSSGHGGTSHPEPGYVPLLNAVDKLEDTPMVFLDKQHHQASYTSLPSGRGGTSHPEPGYVPPLNAVGKLEYPAKQHDQASYSSLPSGHSGTSHPEPEYVPPLNAVGKLEDTPPMVFQPAQHHQASYTSLPSGHGGTSHPEPGYVPPLNAVGKLEDTPPMVFPAKQHNQPSYTSLPSGHGGTSHPSFEQGSNFPNAPMHHVTSTKIPSGPTVAVKTQPAAPVQNVQVDPAGYGHNPFVPPLFGPTATPGSTPVSHIKQSIPFDVSHQLSDVSHRLSDMKKNADAFNILRQVNHLNNTAEGQHNSGGNIKDDKTSYKEPNHGPPDFGASATSYDQAMVIPPVNVVTPPTNMADVSQDDALGLEKTPSQTSLTRVSSSHSAFQSVPPSPRHSNMSLVEEDAYKTSVSPLRSPVQKDKKEMYPTSNIGSLSSLWDNGNHLSMQGVLLSSPQVGLSEEASTRSRTTAVIQPRAAPLGNSKPSASTTDAVPSSQPIGVIHVPQSVPLHGSGIVPGQRQHVQPARPSASTPAACVASQPMASNIERYDVKNYNISESRGPALKTNTSHPTQPLTSSQAAVAENIVSDAPLSNQKPVAPSYARPDMYYEPQQSNATTGHGYDHRQSKFHPDANSSEAHKAGMLRNEHHEVVGTQPAMVNRGYGGYTGSDGSGVQGTHGQASVVEGQHMATEQQQHRQSEMVNSSFQHTNAATGHGYDHRQSNFHPDASHSEDHKAGILQNEHHQVVGTQPAMVNRGYGGYTVSDDSVGYTAGDGSGVQGTHGQASVVEGQHTATEEQQHRQPNVEQQQGAITQHHPSESFEDFDSEEECNRYYDESRKWFWSSKRARWIRADGPKQKRSLDNYDRGCDDDHSDHHRSESSRGRHERGDRENSERRHSRRRAEVSRQPSLGKDSDLSYYVDYYRDYYREYYRQRSESSGSSGGHRRGTTSGHSSGAQTPRSISSRSSSRANKSRSHRRSRDYKDGNRKDYDRGDQERYSSRSTRRRSDSSSYSTSGESNSLSDRAAGYYKQEMVGKTMEYRQEKVPTPERLTPKQHTVPHAMCKFNTASRMCLVPCKHVIDGEIPQVVLANVQNDTSACQVIITFPGPLRRGQTHKRDVVRFAKDMALTAYNNHSRSFEQREASFILWQVLAVMVQQNGVYLNSDIAEVLTAELPDSDLGETKQGQALAETAQRRVSFQDELNMEYNEDLLSNYRELLLCGKTSDALEFAVTSNMWGHALSLSHQLDPKIFSSVMDRFTSNLRKDDSLLCLYQHLSHKRPSVLDHKSGGWRKHLAIMIANPSKSPEQDIKNIFALGENLESRGIFEAAHLCYLLAGTPLSKENGIVLLGENLIEKRPEFVGPESIQRTEIYEYAMSLKDEHFIIPDYQAWKVYYANMLAEAGLHNKSYRYCELIVDNVLKNPTMFNQITIDQICALALRLHKLVFVTPGMDWIEKLQRIQQLKDKTIDSESPNMNEVPQQTVVENINQAVVANGVVAEGQVTFGQVDTTMQGGITNIPKEEEQAAPTLSVPTMFVPNMQTSAEPQVFQSVPYQIAPANDVQGNITGQVGQEPYNGNFNQEFVAEGQLPDHGNYLYGSTNNTQAMVTDMPGDEETNGISRQPSEIHFYGAGVSSSQFYEGDSFEHLKTTPKQNEPYFAKSENVGVSQQIAEQNMDYYSMSSYQNPAETKAPPPAKTAEAPKSKAEEPEKKADDKKKKLKKDKPESAWSIGGFFKSFIPKGKNEMVLPDDKNKSIYWDEKLGKWVNTAESEEEKADLPPPPPIDFSLVSGNTPTMAAISPAASSIHSPPMSSGMSNCSQVTPPQVSAPQAPIATSTPGRFVPEQPEASLVNTPLTTPSRFSRRAMGSSGRKSNYVDVFSASGSTVKPAMQSSPAVLFQPLAPEASFTDAPTPSANETQSSIDSEVKSPASSQTKANISMVADQSDSKDTPSPAVPFFNPADYSARSSSSSSRGARHYPQRK